jgi:opacity protein-like surface antigen
MLRRLLLDAPPNPRRRLMTRLFLRTSLTAGAAAIALLAANSVAAEEPGFYVAGTLGSSSGDFSQSDQDDMDDIVISAWNEVGFTVNSLESDLDKSDVGYELAAGYQFAGPFALEAAYIELGDGTYTGDAVIDNADPGGPYDARTTVKIGAAGPAVSAVLSWPIGAQFSVDARVGAFFAKSTLKIRLAVQGETESESDSETETTMLYGAGISWAFSERASVRLGYTAFKDALFDTWNVDRFSLGFRYAF